MQAVSQLVVEGKDDKHVIMSLCREHNVAETFTIEIANTTDERADEGIEALIKSIPVRLKTARLRSLGIVVDADDDVRARWQSVCHKLAQSGYVNLPAEPDSHGMVIEQEGLPRVGIWVMPDNRLPGMLETFVAHLIPEEDSLVPRARQVLLDLESEGLHKYALAHQPKALIHTWLAWQERPGRPMGQSITARALRADSPLAVVFIDWLNTLFSSF